MTYVLKRYCDWCGKEMPFVSTVSTAGQYYYGGYNPLPTTITYTTPIDICDSCRAYQNTGAVPR